MKTKTHSFESDYLVASPSFPFMYLRVLNADISELVRIFTDQNETSEITYGGETYNGYTKFISISVEDNAYKICLERS